MCNLGVCYENGEGVAEAGVEGVEALGVGLEEGEGVAEEGRCLVAAEFGAGGGVGDAEGFEEAVFGVGEGAGVVFLAAAEEFGGGRGRGGAEVGDEVGDGLVGFVADGGDGGDAGGGDGARDDFLVEGPEVFEGAAAAADDDGVEGLGGAGAEVAVEEGDGW